MLTGQRREHHGEILRHAAELAEAVELTPWVDSRTFTLDTIGAAYEAVETGNTAGKLVVTPE
jgi:NADPH:quinone reductase